ncbi:MAG TPA: hypothetical protein V6C58_18735 [Allocoleopsis sp.]
MDAKYISAKKHALVKARRDYEEKVMHDYDEQYYKDLKALRQECEEVTGHKFGFSNFGPLGHAWYHCYYCGKSKVEN